MQSFNANQHISEVHQIKYVVQVRYEYVYKR
jgi:hypothetical protein